MTYFKENPTKTILKGNICTRRSKLYFETNNFINWKYYNNNNIRTIFNNRIYSRNKEQHHFKVQKGQKKIYNYISVLLQWSTMWECSSPHRRIIYIRNIDYCKANTWVLVNNTNINNVSMKRNRLTLKLSYGQRPIGDKRIRCSI